MICERNFNLPQHIDLDSLKKSFESTNNNIEKLSINTNIEPNVPYEQNEFNILPLFKNQFDHLDDILSLYSNNYLACRWNSFLDNVTENYIRIRLYIDYKESLATRVVRRKMLNGKFYDLNNKIAPIPQLSDPRIFSKNNS